MAPGVTHGEKEGQDMSDQQSRARYQGEAAADLDEQAETCAEGPAAEHGEYHRPFAFTVNLRTGEATPVGTEAMVDLLGRIADRKATADPDEAAWAQPEASREELLERIKNLGRQLGRERRRSLSASYVKRIEERMAVAERLIDVAVPCQCPGCTALRDVLRTQNYVIGPLLTLIGQLQDRVESLAPADADDYFDI